MKKNTSQSKPAAKKVASPKLVITEEFKATLDLLNNTKTNVFITGKAGTGKSTLLRHFTGKTKKKFVVLAPTGVAALNVGGQTIHSFFKFPPAFIHPELLAPVRQQASLFRNLEMIIIDEISMVRADLMEGIDTALRINRNSKKPFGGVQMVFVGDLFQLPPVVQDDDIKPLQKNYSGQYFFDAKVFKELKYHFAELTTLFRQSPAQRQFIEILNDIRNNQAKPQQLYLLNARHNTGNNDNSILLTTHRETARNLNNEKLSALPGEQTSYTAILTGEYATLLGEDQDISRLKSKLAAPYQLDLKEGAQIMMIKNDPERRWVNGSIGKVVRLEKSTVTVDINGEEFDVSRETWKELEYHYNDNASAIEEKITSTFRQFPMQLSWAMTIHKSQGKTFDKVTIDTGSGAFAHGQIYVALSRCTTLQGITLNNPIKESDIIVDPRVAFFYHHRTIPAPTPILPRTREIIEVQPDIIAAIQVAVKKVCAVKILYQNSDGINSERELSQLSFSDSYKKFGYENKHITAYCHMRKMVRTFNMARIKKVTLVA